MIASHKHQFIFFAAGKTGTFSIENVLSKYCDDKFIELEESEFGISGVLPILGTKHAPPQIIKKSSNQPGHLEGFQSYFKFAFVRNPWDWVKCNYFHCFPEEKDTEEVEKCDIIEIPREKLPHLNKGMKSKRKRHYSEFYTEESKELVRKLYKKDIEFFGYEYGQK